MRLRVAGLEKTFRRARPPAEALRNVSFALAERECLAVLGPSGSGKTTLLRVVAGLEKPDSGTVFFGERDVTCDAPERRNCGVVFADDALFPHLDAYANVSYGMRAPSRSAALAVTRRLHVDGLLTRRVDELSSGQRQRIALARALARAPDVLLLDEPFSRLDAPLRAELRRELAPLLRETTTLLVTHDQTEAMALGARIAVMREGRIEQLDTPQNVYDRPATMFVARFVGAPEMTFLPAAALAWHAGGATTIGLRADAVRLSADGPLDGFVEAVEDLGADAFAYVLTSAGRVTARLDRGRPHVGERVCLRLDFERAHAFDAAGARVEDALHV